MRNNQQSLFVDATGRRHTLTFVMVSSLFLLWGFCNGMIDILDKHFQDVLHLTKSQSAWVQFAHWMGYCLMALPAGYLAGRLGYKKGIITGLFVVSLGGMWFVPATHIQAFWAFLLGVFILATGLTFLETIANPYTTVLGSPNYAATRINLAQSCNGVGWILGPIVARTYFYSSKGAEASSQLIYIPYLMVAGAVLVLAILFVFTPMPEINVEDEYHLDDGTPGTSKSIWAHPHFVMGVGAQFLYCAAQAGIFSFFINYMVEELPPISRALAASSFFANGTELRHGAFFVNEQGAALLLGCVGYLLFTVGRFTGTAILSRCMASRVVGIYAAINTSLMLVIFLKLGWFSLVALFLSFFFMSIMFPTIFALGIYGLGKEAKRASSFIVLAIMGSALMPKVMGWLGDHYSMSKGFLMPLFCFAGITAYGFLWNRLSRARVHYRLCKRYAAPLPDEETSYD
jgi:FHS family L-fucose permease-like MFS transporter